VASTADILNPQVASHIATNAYFALGNWFDYKDKTSKPLGGVEERSIIENRVTGKGHLGANQPKTGNANPTLDGTSLVNAKLGNIHTANTGFNVPSGFGYTLTYRANQRTHVVIAMRGTRPEMAWKPDLLTDARAALTICGGVGLVHKGFKATFDSVLPCLERDQKLVAGADVVHVVGHSLGGAIATLIAAHYAGAGKVVRLYTFGSPRVGGMGCHQLIEKRIGKENIFRVAHDLDPITLIGPFPYIHVNGGRRDQNNMTLASPTSQLISTANHDMAEYMRSVSDLDWEGVRRSSAQVDKNNSLLVTWKLNKGEDHSWVKVASVHSLSILLKMFDHVLKALGTAAIIAVTAIDLLAEILYTGIYKSAQLGGIILSLLGDAAVWAGVSVVKGTQLTVQIIAVILSKMLSTMRVIAAEAMANPGRFIAPIPLVMTAGWVLQKAGVI
jgi:pimeloyl-ACP methyl ester carboxylesterase